MASVRGHVRKLREAAHDDAAHRRQRDQAARRPPAVVFAGRSTPREPHVERGHASGARQDCGPGVETASTQRSRALMTDERWQGILRLMDAAYADYLTGMAALRKRVVVD